MITPQILEKPVELSVVEKPVTYEPTVQDRIQRVLYRLESGEQLTKLRLRINNSFCALGLFLDEYQDGEWISDRKLTNEDDSYDIYYHYLDHGINRRSSLVLTKPAVKYYGFNDEYGSFDLRDIKDRNLKVKIDRATPSRFKFNPNLGILNDHLIYHPIFHDETNTLISALIRSGVLFKETSTWSP